MPIGYAPNDAGPTCQPNPDRDYGAYCDAQADLALIDRLTRVLTRVRRIAQERDGSTGYGRNALSDLDKGLGDVLSDLEFNRDVLEEVARRVAA